MHRFLTCSLAVCLAVVFVPGLWAGDDNVPDPVKALKAVDKNLRKAVLTKSSIWRYEREWRIALFDKAHSYASLGETRVIRVFAGAQMPSTRLRALKRVLRRQSDPPGLVIARLSQRKHALTFEPTSL